MTLNFIVVTTVYNLDRILCCHKHSRTPPSQLSHILCSLLINTNRSTSRTQFSKSQFNVEPNASTNEADLEFSQPTWMSSLTSSTGYNWNITAMHQHTSLQMYRRPHTLSLYLIYLLYYIAFTLRFVQDRNNRFIVIVDLKHCNSDYLRFN